MHTDTMMLSVGQKAIRLTSGYYDSERVHKTVERTNLPLAVRPHFGNKKFSVRKRVFLKVDGLSVECENREELNLACKLVALDHNRWQTNDEENLNQVMAETEAMETEAKERMEAPLDEADLLPAELVTEEEDVSIDEWSQMGYKWFEKEEVVYL
jgi:hypothetical protein